MVSQSHQSTIAYSENDAEAVGNRASELILAREAHLRAWVAFRRGPLGSGLTPEMEAEDFGGMARMFDPEKER